MSWRSAGSTWPSSGRRSSSSRSRGREAGPRRRDQRVEVAEQRLAGRAPAPTARSASGDSSRAAGRSWVTSGSVSRGELVRRVAASGATRARTSAARRRPPAARGRAPRSCAKTRVGVRDQRAQLAAALGQRLEHLAGVGHQPLHRRLLAVEDVDAASAASSANGPRLPSASLRSRAAAVDRRAPASCIHVWNAARVRGSKARKISSSSTVGGDLRRPAARPPSGIVGARRRARASARRRSRPAASSGAGSPCASAGSGA